MKRVLVIYYTQSGQLLRILQSALQPMLGEADVQLTWGELKPVRPYPFPWPVPTFLNVFPESVLQIPPDLAPLPAPPPEGFDLVILAYTVWYLAPSPPVSAFLQSPAADVLRDRPVITIVNARDKWLTAQEMVKDALRARGARLSDHVAFLHVGNPLQHTVTTLRWMWTGRKNAFWKFPAAGVGEDDIARAPRFGRAILRALRGGSLDGRKPVLQGLAAVKVDDNTVLQEEVARVVFRWWARRIRSAGQLGAVARTLSLLLFGACLVTLLLVAAPVVLLHRLFIAPFTREAMARKRAYYVQPSGDATDRMGEGV